MSNRPQLILTCEHATNRVPREYAALFRGAQRVLDSHRGYDPGALRLVERLAKAFPSVPLHCTGVSRLLVECNRSAHHPRLFSVFTKTLDAVARAEILSRYYYPHREAVRASVRQVVDRADKSVAVHVGVHSFTPVMDGEVRTADIGLLYDPSRVFERRFVGYWLDAIRMIAPGLCVRRNYPYRGVSDGLTTALRREFKPRSYVGIELELNNALLTRDASTRRTAHDAIVTSLDVALRQFGDVPTYASARGS